LLAFTESIANDRSWMPKSHGVRGDVGKYQRPEANNSATANSDARSDQALRGNPRFGLYNDRSSKNGKGWVAMIVGASAEIAALGDDGIVSDHDIPDAVKLNPVANPRTVSNRYPPGISYTDRRANQYIASNLRSKQANNPPSPSVHCLWRRMHEKRLSDPPQLHH